MILHQDPNTFRQLILLAGEHFHMRPSYVEKDYWVTQILFRLSQSPYVDNVVFKGGTSLSKGYNLINRFSEDVDVAVIHEGLSGNAVKTLIRNVEKGISVDFNATDGFDEIWASLSPTYQTEMASLSYATIPPSDSVAEVVQTLFMQLAKE